MTTASPISLLWEGRIVQPLAFLAIRAYTFEEAQSTIDALVFEDQDVRLPVQASWSLIYKEMDLRDFYDLVIPPLTSSDVFADLRCGFGKLVMLEALTTPTTNWS